MALKPWHILVTPREDLREGKPLDASEFAVHLDQIRDGRAPNDYQKPDQFFERTYLTTNLISLASEAIRRLSGERTETSAVFNMATQFGGGKTHALTLLYHLAKNGSAADKWSGVGKLLERAGVKTVPEAAVAVFVGERFDSLKGRGGDDGTPLRRTPWGEIAYQLGGAASFAVVAEHDERRIAPAGDVIQKMLPADKPSLILIDELMNYISAARKSGMAAQFYSFLQSLSEEARGRNNTVLVVSIPASEIEMNADDTTEYERIKKLLDRLGKAVIMSSEGESSEIIRRRLFEWEPNAVGQNGKIMLSREAIQTCREYANWVVDNHKQIGKPADFELIKREFEDSYPFHPAVLSVFERKWASLPQFQRTRGVLRLLALWVSRAYSDDYKGAHKDPLIGLGTAPLDDALFRTATLGQLGESRLETVVTTDICGKDNAHSIRLDKEAVDAIKKARLHRKVATTIFFESNGGQGKGEATLPEIRLAVAEPNLDIGNVETVLETLTESSYYLRSERNHKYRFSLLPNLNKMLADRRASIKPKEIEERVRAEIRDVFANSKGLKTNVDKIYFPDKSSQIPDRPSLTFVVLPPDQSIQNNVTMQLIETMTRESGNSSRTFKSALIWCVADNTAPLYDDARRLLALEDIEAEGSDSGLDDSQQRQLTESLKKAQRDLTESVWRAYKNIVLLDKGNTFRTVDLGLTHSSSANSILEFLISRLKQDGDAEEEITPRILVKNWPPAFKEWNTKSVRDSFFASPQLPRLLNPNAVKETIAKGVSGGQLAYVGKAASDDYEPFFFNRSINSNDVEISDDMFIITKETAEQFLLAKQQPSPAEPIPVDKTSDDDKSTSIKEVGMGESYDVDDDVATENQQPQVISNISWEGEVPSQKWMTFYNKVLTKFAVGSGLKLSVKVEVSQPDGISTQKIDETKVSLRELGLDDHLNIG